MVGSLPYLLIHDKVTLDHCTALISSNLCFQHYNLHISILEVVRIHPV